jgi:hypothetical protein
MLAGKMTHTKAFRTYGVKPRNANWSWSGRSADGKTVVVTLWKDEFKGLAGQMVYSRPDRGDWSDGPGFRFFMEDLSWARENCDDMVRVIVATPKDEQGQTRRIADCYPQEKLLMRVTHIDPTTGAFTLKQPVA